MRTAAGNASGDAATPGCVTVVTPAVRHPVPRPALARRRASADCSGIMNSGYPTARLVAPSVVEHLATHRAAAAARGFRAFGPEPDAADVEGLIAAAFWASLQREEGRDPRISLAWLPPAQARRATLFERPIGIDARSLAKLAPAVERPGIHLGVWMDGDRPRVWGATGAVPTLTFVIEVVGPGVLVLKYRRGDELDKYGSIAVLEGERAQIVDEAGASLPDCPDLLANLLGFEAPALSVGSNVLVQLAVSMRAHRRGGSLLVVPHDGTEWRGSTAQPIPYAVLPYPGLADLLCASEAAERPDDPIWREGLRRAVDAVAGLTAVDGATIMDTRHQLLAFGAKLVRRRDAERVERVTLTAPIVGNLPEIVDPSVLGGTRHLSAAQFVHDQRDALAMVASQDGRFTVFAWSPCEDMVHAHRVEMLLM